MKFYVRSFLVGVLGVGLFASCVDKPQEVKPEKSGERGSSCQAKNDCEKGLSCIMGLCQEADFGVGATDKECFLVECAEAQDCCGDKPLEAPTKCRAFDDTCLSVVPGCLTQSCLSDAECGGGTCAGTRFCDLTNEVCTDNGNCTQDECVFPVGLGGQVLGTCSFSGTSCSDDTDCTLSNLCGPGTCNCQNPSYDPSDPLCTDEDCMDVCTMVCESERCVEDHSCEEDSECPEVDRSLCSNDGECVQCLEDEDCDNEFDDEDDDDRCLQNRCVSPCKGDAECPQFQACDADTGECEYVGCRSDRECILSGTVSGLSDPRLAKCLIEEEIGRCVVECEVDIHCAADETCQDGSCVYIGCDDDTDCKSILGLHNWEVTDERPWVPEGKCRTVELGEVSDD